MKTDTIAFDRQPHVELELSSRRLKALKIERLLNLSGRVQPIRLLEIGCGAGGISLYFATHSTIAFLVTAVDIHDNRQVREGYDFHQVEGVELPFEVQQFDVVITNHVIEHVGDAHAQMQHLTEIHRVLKADGVGYLAVPNRWMMTEPHYRIKFLSWLPRKWRSRYLRWRGKGDFYDCEPLEMSELENMLEAADLRYHNLCIEGWKATLNIELPDHLGTRLLAKVPTTWLFWMRSAIPTLIYRVERLNP